MAPAHAGERLGQGKTVGVIGDGDRTAEPGAEIGGERPAVDAGNVGAGDDAARRVDHAGDRERQGAARGFGGRRPMRGEHGDESFEVVERRRRAHQRPISAPDRATALLMALPPISKQVIMPARFPKANGRRSGRSRPRTVRDQRAASQPL